MCGKIPDEMFELKKILTHFLLPPGIFILLLVISVLWFVFKRNYKAATVNFVIVALMWFFSIAPVASFLLNGLESDLKVPENPSGDIIVLLGGGVYDNAPDMSGVGAPSEEMDARIITAVRLQKKLGIPVIISGGNASKGRKAEAPIVKRFLSDLGVPEGKLIIEDKSRDTIENAKNTKRICDKMKFRNAILVTSAFHMKRSVMSFEKVGMKVIPFPANFRTQPDNKYTWGSFLPNDFGGTATALHEYLGLLFYKFAY